MSEVYSSTEHIKCPFCGYEYDCGEAMGDIISQFEPYGDGTPDVVETDCPNCDRSFEVGIEVEYTFRSFMRVGDTKKYHPGYCDNCNDVMSRDEDDTECYMCSTPYKNKFNPIDEDDPYDEEYEDIKNNETLHMPDCPKCSKGVEVDLNSSFSYVKCRSCNTQLECRVVKDPDTYKVANLTIYKRD